MQDIYLCYNKLLLYDIIRFVCPEGGVRPIQQRVS